MKILRHHWNKLDREDRWMVKMIAFCITCLVLIHFFAPMKIKTQNIHPPIPSRLFDWLATVEHMNEDSPKGWGISSRPLSTMPPVITSTFMRVEKTGGAGKRAFRLEIEVETFASEVELKITAHDFPQHEFKVEAVTPVKMKVESDVERFEKDYHAAYPNHIAEAFKKSSTGRYLQTFIQSSFDGWKLAHGSKEP